MDRLLVTYIEVNGNKPLFLDPNYIVLVEEYTSEWTTIVLKNGREYKVKYPANMVIEDVRSANG